MSYQGNMSPYGVNPNFSPAYGTPPPNANLGVGMGGVGINANINTTPYGMNARVNF